MELCNKKHSEIVHGKGTCPLCNLTEHNNLVHDFIESKGRNLVNELVSFLNSKNSELSEVQNPASNKQMAAALWSALESKEVHDVGYSFPDSEWMPVNIERLNAAVEKVSKA